MRRVLVTGGSGFGGSHLIRRLMADGAEVWNLDVLPSSSTCAKYVMGDVRNVALLKSALRDNAIDTVFHLAAQPLVPLSIEMPFETLDVNARGTYTVLEACRVIGIQPIPETAAPLPAANLYASGKAAADLAAQGYSHTYDLPVGVCRFMNTYGPGDTNESRIIPRALRLLKSNLPYDFGARDDGSTRLDFLHVDDMTSAYIAVAEFVRTRGGRDAVFNIGTGTATSTADVARMLSSCFDGREREPIFTGVAKATPVVKYLDATKARQLLGWSAQVGLRAGLGRLIRAER
jgi:nucleoside-diphosphate-sugar epimerase